MTERVKGWTAGPWHIDEVNHGLFNNRCLYVCDIPVVPENTHLIAAAPELVVALEELAEVERSEKIGAEWKRDLHAALKKTDAALDKAYGDTNHD